MINQSLPPFPTCVITTAEGAVTVPCEPISDELVITPAFGMEEDHTARLLGDFVITHRRTGKMISDGPGCINCCRSAGKALLKIDVAWSAITVENAADFFKSLPAETTRAIAEARTVNWSCDAEVCDPWPDNAAAERAESRTTHLKQICETNARVLAAEGN